MLLPFVKLWKAVVHAAAPFAQFVAMNAANAAAVVRVPGDASAAIEMTAFAISADSVHMSDQPIISTRGHTMATPPIAEVAQLIGDPGRANMLATLMDGRALTATALAEVARITPQTASSHLSKLVRQELLVAQRRGRHRIFRLASPLVAQMLETMMAVVASGPPRYRPSSKLDDEMRRARTCYDHLAGRLGVAIADMFVARRFVRLDDDAGQLTSAGAAFLQTVGAERAQHPGSRRPYCRRCLDWSERRAHLAGYLGAAIAQACFRQDWIRRRVVGRSVEITPAGEKAFRAQWGIEF
ncbi:ArsR/SmtB family transcription factor [Bradyrhizobium sp.]|uniref:ArsR/SmtB family transcription factor n=1 Tax=Bradyrhizobium sp. TaxID=376 RepID=UPI0025BAEDCB|nr:winged helix-turn-helix domain-containing protein [Bradyrhizobium sp.]